jgi:hypothetical protein
VKYSSAAPRFSRDDAQIDLHSVGDAHARLARPRDDRLHHALELDEHVADLLSRVGVFDAATRSTSAIVSRRRRTLPAISARMTPGTLRRFATSASAYPSASGIPLRRDAVPSVAMRSCTARSPA